MMANPSPQRARTAPITSTSSRARFSSDPPYASVPSVAPTLAELLPQALAPGGRVVLETGANDGFAVPGLVERYNRRIAAAQIVILGAA